METESIHLYLNSTHIEIIEILLGESIFCYQLRHGIYSFSFSKELTWPDDLAFNLRSK